MEERDYHSLPKGTKLNGRYIIEDVLGEGGFGITYAGRDELLGVKVAVKEYYPQGIVVRNNSVDDVVTVTYAKQKDVFNKGKTKFLEEARVIAKFNDQEGIVNVTDFFEANNTAYIVMEYLDGITLKEYIAENGVLSPEDILELMAPVLESLDEVHKQGLIHRDISPDNIMLLKNGKVKLMDFGAARDYTDFGEKSLSIVLKPGYAPEEQYRSRGIQGPWTDIYALSATIYKCITGITPEESMQRVIEDSLEKPSKYCKDIPKGMENAIMKGMSALQKNRYQNLKEFCEALYSDFEDAGEEKKSLFQNQMGL
jgi:Serine/threonine protein kinase